MSMSCICLWTASACAQFSDEFGDDANPHAAQWDYTTGTVPSGNFWTGIHNPTTGGNATMPPVFIADGVDALGNDKAGKLVIQDLNKHPNTNGSLGVGWEATRNNAPFLYREMRSTDNWTATMKIDAQSTGQWSYAPIIARLKGTPPNPVGLGLGDMLHPNESFVAAGRLYGNTFQIRNIINGSGGSGMTRPLPSGTPLWVSLTKIFGDFTAGYSFDGINYEFASKVTNNMLHQYGEMLQIGPAFMMMGGGEGQVEIDSFSINTIFIDIFPVSWTGMNGEFGSGEWTDPGNWCCPIPEYPDSKFLEVVFSELEEVMTPVTINNTEDVTVKSIHFRSIHEHQIAGPGKITLESDDLTARIIVEHGAHEIQLDVALGNKAIAFTSPGATLNFEGPLDFMAPGRTLTVNGGGRLNFNNNTDLPTLGSLVNNGHVGGDGRINASLLNAAGGTVSPGTSAGTLTVDGNYTQDAAATLAIELGGTAASEFDALHVGGMATLNGPLNVTFLDGFVLGPGDSFQILSAASRVGTFSNTPGNLLSTELGDFAVHYTPTAVVLTPFVGQPIMGDYNNNGRVDAADYIVWRNQIGTSVPLLNEGASPGTVDQADYDFWKTNFGKTASIILHPPAVPEPTTFVLLIMTIAALLAPPSGGKPAKAR
jgi:hypothetical protein